MEKLFLFDTSNLVYRSFFGFSGRHLTNSKGEITSGIYGTLKTIIMLYKDFSFDFAVFSLDGPREQTNRFKKYNQYKITREKAPDELKLQLKKTLEILKSADIECVEIQGYESDDIIASSVEKFKDDYEIYIVSGDKDLIQLLTRPNIFIISFSPSKSEYKLIDRVSFIKENNFEPEYIVDYLALVGDSVDNIPGARMIGEKTAKPLIEKYKTIENIYAHLDEIPDKIRNKLIESKDSVFLSKDLVKLFVDPNIDVYPKRFSLDNFRNPKVVELLRKYEFKSIINDIESKIKQSEELNLFSQTQPKKEELKQEIVYKILTKREDLYILKSKIYDKGIVSIDIETDEKNFMECNIIGVAFSIQSKEGYYLPILHNVEKEFSFDEAIEFLRLICEDETIKKIGHNLKYEYVVLKNHNIRLRNIHFDTMIASYVIRPEFSHHNLDRLAEEYLNYNTIKYEEVTKKNVSVFNTLLSVPIEDVVNYSCEDADITFRLYKIFDEKLKLNPKLENLFYQIEMPLVEVLGEMEFNGIKVDKEYLISLGRDIEKEINQISEKIFSLVGEVFNINSPKQLAYILFEKLKLEPTEKTKTGFSTSEKALEELEGEHEVIDLILRYRTLSKLKNTYVDELPNIIIPKTGRVHTSFNQTVTATGRLSSSNPNLQNIPIRDDIGKKIRYAFIAEEGNLLGSFDYSQIELRVLAHISQDEVLIQQFKENRDIHSETASKILGVPMDQVTPDMRRIGKTINFGIIYGISAYGLSKQLRISVSEASEIIERYFQNFKGIKDYIFRTLEFASKYGYVETMFGRMRKVPELLNKKYRYDKLNLGKSERIAINTPIQGSAAEIVKIAMNKLYQKLKDTEVKILLQVHDEILVEIPENKIKDYDLLIKNILEEAIELRVPLVVEYSFGKSWGEIHD
ncbi:MAG: DNA polymerase I [Brevinematia bacterium]